MAEKRPGHENLLAAADAVLEAKPDELTEGQRDKLVFELVNQADTRRNDFIPENVRNLVVSQVVRAGAKIYSFLPDPITALAMSNLGQDGLTELLDQFDEEYVLLASDQAGRTNHIVLTMTALMELQDSLTWAVHLWRPPTIVEGTQVSMAFVAGSSPVPIFTVIWRSTPKPTSDETAAARVMPSDTAPEEPSTSAADLRPGNVEPEPAPEVIPVVTDEHGGPDKGTGGATGSVPLPDFENGEGES